MEKIKSRRIIFVLLLLTILSFIPLRSLKFEFNIEKLFPVIPPVYTNYFLGTGIILEISFQPEAIFIKVYIKKVGTGKIAFCKTAIIDCIKQVRFSFPIHAADPYYIPCKFKLL